jgi:low temperature requirement protein LtrA
MPVEKNPNAKVHNLAAFAEQSPDHAGAMAFLACFASSALMWWIYFDIGADRGAQHIAHSGEVGRIARNAYTYLHMPIVGGVVATAVSDALLMAQPAAVASPALIAAGGGGLVGYLASVALFKRYSSPRGNPPLSHLIGLVLLISLIVTTRWWAWKATDFTACCDGVLLIVAIWEWGSFHGGWLEMYRRWGLPV